MQSVSPKSWHIDQQMLACNGCNHQHHHHYHHHSDFKSRMQMSWQWKEYFLNPSFLHGRKNMEEELLLPHVTFSDHLV
jgi:hypothetical protein